MQMGHGKPNMKWFRTEIISTSYTKHAQKNNPWPVAQFLGKKKSHSILYPSFLHYLTWSQEELSLSLHTGPPEGLNRYSCCKEGLNRANNPRGITAESVAKYRTGVWSKNTGGEFCPPARELSNIEALLPLWLPGLYFKCATTHGEFDTTAPHTHPQSLNMLTHMFMHPQSLLLA